MAPTNEEKELKSKHISYRAKPSHKHRLESVVKLGQIPDIRNLSELVEYFAEDGLERLEHLSRDHGRG